jgi:hypothetical protein
MIDRTELLQQALVGYQMRRQEIETRMEGLRQQLAGAARVEVDRPKRQLSAKGRRSLIAATKKRWREAKKGGRRTLG